MPGWQESSLSGVLRLDTICLFQPDVTWTGSPMAASVASYPPMGRPVNICDDDTNKALLADEDVGGPPDS